MTTFFFFQVLVNKCTEAYIKYWQTNISKIMKYMLFATSAETQWTIENMKQHKNSMHVWPSEICQSSHLSANKSFQPISFKAYISLLIFPYRLQCCFTMHYTRTNPQFLDLPSDPYAPADQSCPKFQKLSREKAPLSSNFLVVCATAMFHLSNVGFRGRGIV